MNTIANLINRLWSSKPQSASGDYRPLCNYRDNYYGDQHCELSASSTLNPIDN